MSWDIFVRDIPAGVQSCAGIPDDFRSKPLGRRADLIAKLVDTCPIAHFSDPGWGIIETDEFAIEVNIPSAEPLMVSPTMYMGAAR